MIGINTSLLVLPARLKYLPPHSQKEKNQLVQKLMKAYNEGMEIIRGGMAAQSKSAGR